MFYDKHAVESVHLRIGSCVPEPLDTRHLATWLSYGDLVRLIIAALTTQAPGYAIVWGISRNSRRWWIGDDAERIGFFPEDDAERFAGTVSEEWAMRSTCISGRYALCAGFGGTSAA